MNERIKELMEQAGIEFTYDPTETPMRAFVECWEDDLEKFAEMIVSECVGMLDDEDDYGYENRGVRNAAYRIKKRFGVEE